MSGDAMRVLIVGAGPAGAMAGLVLARGGARITLIEKSAWPRAKTCGDGISPHAIHLGSEVGLHFEGRVHLERALVTTPSETAFTGGWPAAMPWGTTIERREFDASLVDAAVAAGVVFVPATAVTSLKNGASQIVATLRCGEDERTVSADVVLIAEGATGSLAAQLDFPPYRSRLVALRGYADAPRALEQKYGLFYDRMLSPGYGWVFPMDDRRANVGICIDERVLARLGGNLRAAFARWLAESRFARELLGDAPAVHELRGGIIPTGRRVRAIGRALLIGDAAGVADPFTAEGIFQAMLSGRLAADALLRTRDMASARTRYERALRVFDRNERAARWVRATFGVAIEPYARRAARRPAFADHLNTDVFLPKPSFRSFVWRLTRAALSG
jgi:geranylgeranyl reductase family protein